MSSASQTRNECVAERSSMSVESFQYRPASVQTLVFMATEQNVTKHGNGDSTDLTSWRMNLPFLVIWQAGYFDLFSL